MVVTVVFADLTGSTGVYESLGNTKATQAITRLTKWIGAVCEAHGGHVVKYLGDGVLLIFQDNSKSVEAVTELQRVHRERISRWPEQLQLRLKAGMARGEVVEQNGDCFGDAVNVAARLSDLSAPGQILSTDAVIEDLPIDSLVRFRSLGSMAIRGRTQPCIVYRIEWQPEILSEFFTVPAELLTLIDSPLTSSTGIELSWLNTTASYDIAKLPMFMGRDVEAGFVLQDPRVSRKHARIEWRAGKFHLEDISSYGTWIRFNSSGEVLALRRQECTLLGEGEIALGAPFEDFTVPTVSFRFLGSPS